ncbi:MAG TPA: GIY-YIG nuclease family protein [Candidatus Moranbacteria bacterium]|nr:GIY-YIG nuclease family protein [Candidatus Moranbacteria bacterium]
MNFHIYLLVDEKRTRTYVGFSDNIERRLSEHLKGEVKTTKNFGNLSWQILEKCANIKLAREAEKYWKSSAGRKRIREIFKNNLPLSSSG